MTDVQFERLLTILTEINQNLKLITAKDTEKEVFGLSDIWDKLGSVESSITSVEDSVHQVKNAVNNIDIN